MSRYYKRRRRKDEESDIDRKNRVLAPDCIFDMLSSHPWYDAKTNEVAIRVLTGNMGGKRWVHEVRIPGTADTAAALAGEMMLGEYRGWSGHSFCLTRAQVINPRYDATRDRHEIDGLRFSYALGGSNEDRTLVIDATGYRRIASDSSQPEKRAGRILVTGIDKDVSDQTKDPLSDEGWSRRDFGRTLVVNGIDPTDGRNMRLQILEDGTGRTASLLKALPKGQGVTISFNGYRTDGHPLYTEHPHGVAVCTESDVIEMIPSPAPEKPVSFTTVRGTRHIEMRSKQLESGGSINILIDRSDLRRRLVAGDPDNRQRMTEVYSDPDRARGSCKIEGRERLLVHEGRFVKKLVVTAFEELRPPVKQKPSNDPMEL